MTTIEDTTMRITKTPIDPGKRLRLLCASLVAAAVALCVTASAASAGALWEMDGHHSPTNFEAGGTAQYSFTLNNIGDAADAGPVSVEIRLPSGVTSRVVNADGSIGPATTFATAWWRWNGGGACPGAGGASTVSCSFDGPFAAGGGWAGRLMVFVDIAPGTTGDLTAEATVTGGGAPVTVSETARVGREPATFGIAPGTFKADAYDRVAVPERQAGAHPYRATFAFDLNQRTEILYNGADGLPGRWPVPIGTPRNLEVAVPRGFLGNPEAADHCTALELAEPAGAGALCPINSQVGVVNVAHTSIHDLGSPPFSAYAPVYNMAPPKGALADLAFQVEGRPVHIIASLDPKDYSVVTKVRNINESYPVYFQKLTLWGVPADPVHDADRWDPVRSDYGAAHSGRRVPFLSLPAECGVPGVTKLMATSWQGDTFPLGADAGERLESAPQVLEGCERQRFEPSIDVAVDTARADAPAGLTVRLDVPQNEEPEGLATPPLRDAKVTLPEGMTINPAAADGLEACSDAQLGLGTDDPIGCPAGSKIGSVTALSPAIDGPVEGGVYIRSQNSDDPQSGEMFRMAIVFEHPERGLLVKLPGSVSADPRTGRLATRFADNPQLPVSSIRLRLKGGFRAPLATPRSCGVKTVEAELSSWGGHVANLVESFTIDCPGANGFAPAFEAGTTTPTGGAFSPFIARIDRPDRQQFLSGVQVDLPRGLIAKLKGVELCPEAVAAEGTLGVCPAATRIGTATVGAGAGNPFYLQGPVYLTDGYKGAPYGLSVQVRAKAGPFDLGLVKVAQAIHVDPDTAELSVVSDPLPQIVKGVPVRLRSVDVDIDRPGFTINPTSCSEKQIQATFTSVDGATSKASQSFQANDCSNLAFTPKLAMRLTGARQTKTGGHPKLKAILTQRSGQANVKSAKVTLPRSLALDANNSTDPKLLCDYDRALKADCPASSVIGKASAVTPVLNKPLRGNVHLVQGIAFGKKGNRIRTLPTLLVKLRGEVAIDLRAKTNARNSDGRLQTTFPAVPDAPVSKFAMTINGGPKGILTVTRTATRKLNLCTTKQTASVETDAQNGKRADFATTIKTPCGQATKAKGGSRAKTGKRRR